MKLPGYYINLRFDSVSFLSFKVAVVLEALEYSSIADPKGILVDL